MKQEDFYEILGDIDEKYIQEAHLETNKTGRFAWIKWAAPVAGLILFLSAIAVLPQIIKRTSKEDPSQASTASSAPQYVPAYSSPDLAELYQEAPYSELLPRKVPETWKFESSYKTEYDPLSNPTDSHYLELSFASDQSSSKTVIKVVNFTDFSLYGEAVITDPAKPETYDLALYYDYMENTPGALGADAPKVLNALFRAEDLSVSIADKRIYDSKSGLCTANISVLCGEYVVMYEYSGTAISPEVLFEIITSSKYFSE